MDDRRRAAPGVGEGTRIDSQGALAQHQVLPHGQVGMQGSVAVAYVESRRQVEHRPQVPDPRPRCHHDVVAPDRATIGLDRGDGVAFDPEPEDPHPGQHPDARRLGLGRKPPERVPVVGVAAAALVQHVGDARRLPVAEQVPQVGAARSLALDEGRGVPDLPLLGVDPGHVGVHRGRGRLEVADGVVREGHRVGLPDRDRVRHQPAHRGLEVVVADHAAGDAGRAGSDPGLVEDHDVCTRTRGAGLEPPGQVPCGGQPVHAGAHHYEAATRRDFRPRAGLRHTDRPRLTDSPDPAVAISATTLQNRSRR